MKKLLYLFILSAFMILGYLIYDRWQNLQIVDGFTDTLERTGIVYDSATAGAVMVGGVEVSDLISDDTAVQNVTSNQRVKKVSSYRNVISIPNLGILAYINNGVSQQDLATGVGRHTGTPKGSVVLAGHSSESYSCVFNNLHKINLYDKIFTYDSSGKEHQYYVLDKYVCDAGAVGILKDKDEKANMLTLYTCTDKGARRFVVVSKEFTDAQLEDYKAERNALVNENMEKLIAGIDLDNVSDSFMLKRNGKYREYTVPINSFKVKSIKEALLGKGDKPHTFNLDFDIGVGVILKGDRSDIPENKGRGS